MTGAFRKPLNILELKIQLQNCSGEGSDEISTPEHNFLNPEPEILTSRLYFQSWNRLFYSYSNIIPRTPEQNCRFWSAVGEKIRHDRDLCKMEIHVDAFVMLVAFKSSN